MWKRLGVAILLWCAVSTAQAKVFDDKSELRPFLDSVMQIVADGKFDQAISKFRPYMTMPEDQIQGVALQIKSARQQAKTLLGETIGYEYLGKKVVGESLIRFVYLEKTTKSPLVWVFVMYRNDEGWVIPSFQFNAGTEEPFYRDYDPEE
ncbi:hypothetical protein [Salinisphaera sp.]|uniref:hypothetical protein n=1 Tax=Salinisphaera sp. TaxID=1914330 RepID=UPI0025DD0476|nr:hypothetical protein [Salinisphaera sp.]